jgi:hypothetical protein
MSERTSPVEIMDANDDDLQDYTSKLSSILENNNVTILHTSTGSVILRPDKISSILVSEPKDEDETHQLVQPAKEESKEEIHEDIITD